jgi:hypothetical protein
MQIHELLERIQHFPAALQALLGNLPPEDARWRPAPDAWSIVEIVCHLADEEHEDFRTRLRLTLEDPTADWPPLEPETAVQTRAYRSRDLGESLGRMDEARSESCAWLRDLDEPDWDRVHEHPDLGPLRAGDLMLSWAAHDALHLRQLAQRLFQLAQRDAAGYSPAYAGDWS